MATGLATGASDLTQAQKDRQTVLRQQWSELRRQFVRFYGLRASITFSLGSHDEWLIFRLINERRQIALQAGDNLGVAEQLAGFFDQSQINPSATEDIISRGYSIQAPSTAIFIG